MGCILSKEKQKEKQYRDVSAPSQLVSKKKQVEEMNSSQFSLNPQQQNQQPIINKPKKEEIKKTHQFVLQDEGKAVQMPPFINALNDGDERLLVQSEDRRIEACISCRNTFPLNCIGKVITRLKGLNTDGTGFLISKNLILTSAHNVCIVTEQRFNVICTNSGEFYVGFNGMNPNRYELSRDFFINPIFIKICERINKIHTQLQRLRSNNLEGQVYQKKYDQLAAEQYKLKIQSQQHDYALIRLKNEVNLPEYLSLDTFEPAVGSEATVSGGNQKFGSNFKLLSHTGTIQEVTKRVIYYNIDTEKGQSGSPVLVKKGEKARVIAIHKGYFGQNNLNLGTRITPQFIRQIEEWAEQMGVNYKNEQSNSAFCEQKDQRFNQLRLLFNKKEEELNNQILLNKQLKKQIQQVTNSLLQEKRRHKQERGNNEILRIESTSKISKFIQEIEDTNKQIDKISIFQGDSIQMTNVIQSCMNRLQKLQITDERLSLEQKKIVDDLKKQLQRQQEQKVFLEKMKEQISKIAERLEHSIKSTKSWQLWDTTTSFANKFDIKGNKAIRSAQFDDNRYQVVSLPLPTSKKPTASLKIKYGNDGGIMIGLITSARRDKQYSYGGDTQTLSYCTYPKYSGEKKGWIEMDQKTIVNGSSDLFVENDHVLQVEVDMDEQIVVFFNSTNKSKYEVKLTNNFAGKQLHLFATMREKGDFIGFV